MSRPYFGLLILLTSTTWGSSVEDRQSVVIVVGAEGEAEFGKKFAAWADRWEKAAQLAEARVARIGEPGGDESDRDRLRQQLETETGTSTDTLWLVLIGHGTFDGRTAKFNLRGPDVSAADLAEWLQPIKRPVVVVNNSSSSSPFLQLLSGANRVVITATRSGHERNFAYFGEHFSLAITDAAADLDKDGQTSVLEAFLQGAHRLNAFYEEQARLATEHPLIDDNADGLGTAPDWFHGTRAVKVAKDGAAADGLRAQQIALVRSEQEKQLSTADRQRRDELEVQLAALRDDKPKLDEAIYYQRLEAVLLELAELYSRVQR